MVTVVNREGTRNRGRSRREQYRSMLRLAAAHSPRREALATDGVDEVCAVLRRHDRIVWFLRLWSRDLLEHGEHMPSFTVSQRRRKRRLEKALGPRRYLPDWRDRRNFLQRWWRLELAAETVPYLRRTLAAYRLSGYRSFQAAGEGLRALETAVERMRDHQQAVDVIWIFPNGWRWVRCAYDSSVIEGRALGHCGNRANRDPDCQLLSLREPVWRDGILFWHPHLTFTLTNGYLGEMKSRFNEKPGRRYHSYIVNLLLNPMVKGLSPRLGAMPDRDFELSDLDRGLWLRVMLRVPSLKWEERVRAMANWRARYQPGAGKAAPRQAPAPQPRKVEIREQILTFLTLVFILGPAWLPLTYILWHALTQSVRPLFQP